MGVGVTTARAGSKVGAELAAAAADGSAVATTAADGSAAATTGTSGTGSGRLSSSSRCGHLAHHRPVRRIGAQHLGEQLGQRAAR